MIIITVIRPYRPSDLEKLAELFYHTVHITNSEDYSQKQLYAWADGNIDMKAWNDSFLSHCTLVAEADNIIAGFGDIDRTGYLDRLFVLPQFQNSGIATALCDALEHSCDSERITTHASVTARGFFEKRGYKVIKKQQVKRKGIFLTNYVMVLDLL